MDQNLLSQFKTAVVSKNNESSKTFLDRLKAVIINLDSLPPFMVNSPNASEERIFGRDFWEYAVLHSINSSDKQCFQRYFTSLKSYYSCSSIPKSEMSNDILGLYLMYLILENRLSDFHSELEMLSAEQLAAPSVVYCAELDRHLMSGSFDQVLTAASHPPSPHFQFFLSSLLHTVRLQISESLSVSAPSLSLSSAQTLLMFPSLQETFSFVEEHCPDWISPSSPCTASNPASLLFPPAAGKGLGGVGSVKRVDDLPSHRVISQTLSYATELERIV